MKIIFIVIAVLVLAYLFLIAPRMWKKPDCIPFKGVHYAHRGLFDNASDAPENSLAAFRKAVDKGYGIELDVQLSKDEKLVVFHDVTLERMCGVKGNVRDYTLHELRQLKLGNSNEKIPTLEAFLKVVDGKVPFILEYKLHDSRTIVCELVNEVLKNYKGTYCIESFHHFVLMWYRKNRPDVLRGQLCEEFFRREKYRGNPFYWVSSFLLFNVLTRPDFIAYNHKHANNISRRICRKMGRYLSLIPLKARKNMKMQRKNSIYLSSIAVFCKKLLIF